MMALHPRMEPQTPCKCCVGGSILVRVGPHSFQGQTLRPEPPCVRCKHERNTDTGTKRLYIEIVSMCCSPIPRTPITIPNNMSSGAIPKGAVGTVRGTGDSPFCRATHTSQTRQPSVILGNSKRHSYPCVSVSTLDILPRLPEMRYIPRLALPRWIVENNMC